MKGSRNLRSPPLGDPPRTPNTPSSHHHGHGAHSERPAACVFFLGSLGRREQTRRVFFSSLVLRCSCCVCCVCAFYLLTSSSSHVDFFLDVHGGEVSDCTTHLALKACSFLPSSSGRTREVGLRWRSSLAYRSSSLTAVWEGGREPYSLPGLSINLGCVFSA